jgi:aerobic-type carbon monoxide dehydrogenase small subunit (CoxS/CutS family)
VTDMQHIRLVVNGQSHELDVEARRSLVEVLREDLGLVGAHIGCEQGVCGTCTVLMDGESVRGCLMLAVQCDGAEITTVEGLAQNGQFHPLQEAFWERQALQCGFCTPGMLLRALELLNEDPEPSAEKVREGIASNLCRCTGYQFIVEAVLDASQRMRSDAIAEGQPFEPAAVEQPARRP